MALMQACVHAGNEHARMHATALILLHPLHLLGETQWLNFKAKKLNIISSFLLRDAY
jgi:hypothetical protein